MIFSLEAVKAKHGDALLLHYGSAKAPGLIVIDGGPDGVYNQFLDPRLEELRSRRHPDGAPLKIQMLMVSHIDADHIQGALEMTQHLLEIRADGGSPPFDITRLWYNSFSDLVKKVKLPKVQRVGSRLKGVALGEDVPPDLGIDRYSALVLASVAQGRQLRDNAKALDLLQGELILAPETGGPKTYDPSEDLRFTVLGPMQRQLDRLQNDWAQKIAEKKARGALSEADMQVALAELVDNSVYNLSSIVVLAESREKKKMLLTGDARGDLILQGLELAGLAAKGESFSVDLMKVPHHGSDRNVTRGFFEKIRADHYVISADGRFGNPDEDTLRMLFAARGEKPYTISMTYEVERLREFLRDNKPANVDIRYPKVKDRSVRVDLGDVLTD